MDDIIIPYCRPNVGTEEKQAVSSVIDSLWIGENGKAKEFEDVIKSKARVKHAIACCNGTMAIYIMMKVLGNRQKRIVMPTYSMIASANGVLMSNNTIDFLDVNKETCCLDKSANVKGDVFMPICIYGAVQDFDVLVDKARNNGMVIAGDMAQALGVMYKGKTLFEYCDIATLSFYPDKILTTGEGGMILTNDDVLAERCVRLKRHGNLSMGLGYVHDSLGYNFRMADILAAIGLAQFKRLDTLIALKREHDALYRGCLNGCVEFTKVDTYCFNVPFSTVVFVDNPNNLRDFLLTQGIEARRVYYPLNKQPCYKSPMFDKMYNGDCDNAMWIYEHGLALPNSTLLKDDEIKYVCDKIREFVG